MRRSLCLLIAVVVWGVLAPPARAAIAIAIDPNSPSTLYFARYRGYFMRSDDSGQTWAVRSAGLPLTDVQSILAIGSPTVLYAATGAGVYRSTDRGDTWSTASEGLGAIPVSVVSASPAAPAILYAATASGLFRSSDAARTWTFTGLANVSTVAADPVDASLVYAGVSNTLYRSPDFGRTWAKTGAIFPILTSAYIANIAIDPNDPGTLLIAEITTFLDIPHKVFYRVGYLFVSHDRGSSTSRVVTPLDDGVDNVAFDSSSTAYIGSGSGPDGRIASSVDGGAHWTVHRTPVGFGSAIAATDSRVLVAGQDGLDQILFLSDDHGSTLNQLPISPCLGLREQLCFVNGLYRAELTASYGGREIHGIAFPITPDAGAFWFFSPNNIEVVVKIVDGREFNGAYWLFGASLTDLGFMLSVIDKNGSGIGQSQNPGEMRSFADLNSLRGEFH